ncbi:MAG: hypothetical protein RMM08_02915, partial [Armatimonadota bacterium]|nr:hypothetical protein [Armatimonadota bacterium]
MNSLSITRRQFHLVMLTSAVALTGRSGAQEPSIQPEEASCMAAVNAWLPAPMPPEQARKVAEAVRSMQKTLESLRACRLPEGSEPAFVFQPHP